MSEIEINGIKYQIGKLDAFKQFHVARRLAPILFSLGEAAASVDLQKVTGDAAMLQAIGPMVHALSAMSDADTQYVLNACLAVCSRQSGAGWQRVFVEPSQFMFQDIDLPVMMQLAVAVIQGNLGNFLPALPVGQ